MKSRSIFALAGLAIFAAALWRAAPHAGEGEILVLPDRALAGPVRAWVAPWSSRSVVPVEFDSSTDLSLPLGQGANWPLSVAVRFRLDAAGMQADARAAARGGPEGLRARAAEWCGAAVETAGRITTVDPREALSRPQALSTAIREALQPLLPDGIEVTALTAEVRLDEDETRRFALADARSRGTKPVARVLYIGLDGADWEIASSLMARGELPVLSRLVRDGVRADLVSYEPMMSPLLWTTAITGRTPDVHGIFDFTVSDAHDEQIPISSRFRKSAAIWEILSAWGDRSAFVNFWATHPTEEIHGVLVSDIADSMLSGGEARKGVPAGVVWPDGFLDTVRDLWTTGDVPLADFRQYLPSATAADLADAQAYWNDPARKKAYAETEESEERKVPPDAFLVKLAATSHNLERMTLRLLEKPDFGVVGVYFGDIDQVGHNFQHLAPPPHPLADPAERRRYADVVANTYRQQDGMLDRLIRAAGPDVLVVIHSDHGFQWGDRRPRDVRPYTGGQPVEWHRMQGMFLASGGPARHGARVPEVTLYDIAPTLLALRGVPPAENMPGRVRTDLLEPDAAARLPRSRVPDWDTAVGPRSYSTEGSGGGLDEARREMIDQLRALGYVGGSPGETEREERTPERPGGGEEATGAPGEEHPRVTYYRTKATWLMNQDRFAEAEEALLEANRVKPLPKTYSLLSEARAARGDLPGAVSALKEGFEVFPDELPVSAVLWMVELEIRLGDLPAAEAALRRGLEGKDSGAAPLIVARGRIAEAKGDGAVAREAYLAALAADPREVRAAQRYAALSTSPAERGRLEPYLRKALDQDPRIEVYWQMLGLIRLDAGDPAGAADAFKEAADLEPAHEGNRVNEALASLRAGQKERARRRLEALASTGSALPVVWANLAQLRAEAGDRAGARAALERAVELAPDDPRLREALDRLRRRGGP